MSTIYQKIVRIGSYCQSKWELGGGTWLVRLFSTLFFLVLVFSLLWPQPLGLADNHDYWRLANPWGLHYLNPQPTYVTNLEVDFVKTTDFRPEVVSSGLLLVAIAYVASGAMSATSFSLLWLGIVHCLAYSYAFYRLLASVKIRNFCVGLLFFVVGGVMVADSLFTSYFVSFYQESAFFVFTLLWVGVFLDTKKHFWWEVVLLLLILFSKVSQSIDIVLLVPLLVKYRDQSKLFIKGAVVLLLCCFAIFTNLHNDQTATEPNIYHSFFTGLVNRADNQLIFRDLGLDPKVYASFVGKNFWEVNQADPLLRAFYQQVQRKDILSYYINHPALLLGVIKDSLVQVGRQVRPDLGNRTLAFSSAKVVDTTVLAWWQRLLPKVLVVGLILLFLQGIYLMVNNHYSKLVVLILSLTVLLPLQLMTVLLGDGIHELSKHTVPFYFFFTLLILVSIYYWFQSPQEKTINQN